MFKPRPTLPEPAERMATRRGFLLYSIAIVGSFAAVGLPGRALAQGAAGQLDFHALAEFLTARRLDLAFVARADTALKNQDPGFEDAMARLADLITRNGVEDIEALKQRDDFTGDLKSAAVKLISALYLGYAGEPKKHSSVDNVQFVGFSQALTFQATHAFTPVPSYARWGTGYWEHLPDAL